MGEKKEKYYVVFWLFKSIYIKSKEILNLGYGMKLKFTLVHTNLEA